MKKFRNSRNNIYIYIAVFVVVFCLVVRKLYVHEKWQSEQIHSLSNCVIEQREELEVQNNRIAALEQALAGNDFSDLCTEAGFDYLAIGNSITIHGICDYWWEEYGMAASSVEKDYYHQVVSWLEQRNDCLNTHATNFSSWEIASHDRTQTFSQLIPYLNEHIDLITLQLGENVKDLETYEKDFEELLKFLKEKAPNAQILVIGDFWQYEDRNVLKQKAVQTQNVEYIDLSEIMDNPYYESALGEKVYDSDGTEHVIEHSGVAKHPGDAGMAFIASKIIEILQESE